MTVSTRTSDRNPLSTSPPHTPTGVLTGEWVCTAAAGIFSLGYLIFQVPSNLVITKVGAPTWLGFLIFCWGIIAASTAAMKNKGTFYARKAPLFPKK